MSKKTNIKIGLVARADNSGLGTLSYDLYRHLPIHKVLIASSQYPQYFERFDEAHRIISARGIPSKEECLEFIEDLDVLFCVETPYNWNIIEYARKKGVKTVLMVMYEWTPLKENMPAEFDLYLCPTKVDYDTLWGNKKLIPMPVDRDKTVFNKRTTAKTFIFNNGHGGVGGRNSLQEYLQAIQFVKSDVKFIVRSQVPFEMPYKDTRIKVQLGEVSHDELWSKGDIYVHAHKFDGLSLPLQEALAAGFPIMAVNREPYNEILPKELLFEPGATGRIRMTFRHVEAVTIAPDVMAEKIDEIAKMSDEEITKFSEKSNELADEFSWETLQPKYVEILEELVRG